MSQAVAVRRPLSRRRALRWGLGAAGAAGAVGALKLALRAAGGPPDGDRDTAPTTVPGAARPVTVAVPTGGFYSLYLARTRGLLDDAVRSARRLGDDRFRVEIDELRMRPRAAGESEVDYPRQIEAVAPLVAAGQPPDLLALASWPNPGGLPREFRAAAGAGWLAPLDDHLRADTTLALSRFLPAALDICRPGGQLLAVPLIASPALLVYDPRLVDPAAAGVPPLSAGWDWQQLLDAIPRLTREGASGVDQYAHFPGFATSGVLSLLWQGGAEVVSADGRRSRLLEPAARGAVEFLAELYRRRPPVFRRPASPAGADIPNGPGFSWSWSGGVRVDGRWTLASLVQGLAGVADLRPGQLAVAELPRGRRAAAALGVPATLSVNARGSSPAHATAALAFLAERVTRVHVADLPPRDPSAPLIDTFISHQAGLDPSLRMGQAIANSLAAGRALVVGSVTRTERVHAVLSQLVEDVQDRPEQVGAAMQAADERLQQVLDSP